MNIAPVTGRRSARGAFLPTGLCIFVYFRGSWRRGKLKTSHPDRVRVMCAKTGRGSTCARELKRYPEVGPLYPATKRVPPQCHSFNAALSPTFSTSKQTSSRRPSMPLRPHSPRVLPTSCSFLGSTLSIFDNSLSPFTTKPILCASSQQQRTTRTDLSTLTDLHRLRSLSPPPAGH